MDNNNKGDDDNMTMMDLLPVVVVVVVVDTEVIRMLADTVVLPLKEVEEDGAPRPSGTRSPSIIHPWEVVVVMVATFPWIPSAPRHSRL